MEWTEEHKIDAIKQIHNGASRNDVLLYFLTLGFKVTYKSLDNMLTSYQKSLFDAHQQDVLETVEELLDTTNNWEIIAIELFEILELTFTAKFLKNRWNEFRVEAADFSNQVDLLKTSRKQEVENLKLRRNQRLVTDVHNSTETVLEQLQGILNDTAHQFIEKYELPNIPVSTNDGTVVAVISDTHFGLKVDPYELNNANRYNNYIAANRFGSLLDHLLSVDSEDYVLVFNGDLLSGVIHDTKNNDLLSTQFATTLNYLIQFISTLAKYSNSVTCYFQPGNHGRFPHKNQKKISDEKFDSIETMVAYALKMGFINTNVEINISKAPYTIVNIGGNNTLITHGDTFIKMKHPAKNIKSGDITAQLNTFALLNEKIDTVLLGHHHFPTYFTTETNTSVIINGSMIGLDPFAQSIGILGNSTKQVVYEIKNGSVHNVNFVDVNQYDSNSIRPFELNTMF